MTEDINQINTLKAAIQVLINDQAYLYALLLKETHVDEAMIPVTEEVFEKWQDEWKRETAENIERILNGTTDDFS